MKYEDIIKLGEYGAAGMYKEPHRSLFYRKALGLRMYYENCALPEYNGELLYPSGASAVNMAVFPGYMDGFMLDKQALKKKDKDLTDEIISDFYRYESSVPVEHSCAGNMYTHSMPNYQRILKEGLLSYRDRIEKISDNEIKDGLMHLLTGLECYIKRCTRYLENIKADIKLINALKKVPLYPAENIYEALVSWNFVMYLDNCDNIGSLANGLSPYYKGEDIVHLLENLYDNLDSNNGYSMSIVDANNPLTVQCLEAAKGKRRPMIELFVDENTPDAVWEKAFDVIRTNNGQPAFYNPSVLLGGLKEKFPIIRDEDLEKFCGGGCTESMFEGLSCVGSIDAGLNLPLIMEGTIYDKLAECETFDEFYNHFIRNVQSVAESVAVGISKSQKDRAELNPLPMRTLLVDDCIDTGKDFNNGGARYKWSIVNFAGMINVIDSMLVINDYIFRDKTYTKAEFIEKLRTEDEAFIIAVRNHPLSHGKDIAEANEFSKRISSDIYSVFDDKKPYIGEGFLPCAIQFKAQVENGKAVGATPCGRKKGAPLCDSLGAIYSKDTNGPTALLKSVSSLALDKLLGIPVLSFNINDNFNNEVLKGLILGYMKLGGIQMQITCASADLMKEAYENPQLHKNLVVRVGGYSEYFNRLSDELKKMILERTIQNNI